LNALFDYKALEAKSKYEEVSMLVPPLCTKFHTAFLAIL
jgi:hypothetical protein